MGKRDVIVRFVIAAAVWLTVAAVVGEEIGGRPGEVFVAVAVLILMAVAWATFTPNARLFGRVVGLGSTSEPMVAITNALNLSQKGVYKDLQTIPPGGFWSESFWITTKGY